MFSHKVAKTQREEQHGNAFPSVSISVHQWLNIVFRSWFSCRSWLTLFFDKSLVWRHESFDYARDQARRLSGVWVFVVPYGNRGS